MSMTITWTLGELIAKARRDAGLDQPTLARAAKIARSSLSNYETGRSVPPFDVMVRIALVTGVSLEWLATAVNAETAPTEVETVSQLRAPRDSNPQPSDWSSIDLELAFWRIVEAVAA